ncbi:hypothetical protein F4780DRAFT_748088 [Xylariomycetidae sp. FL0641]|nr:hypothetical protein F4780DRAFT_748088 [Xylariomycetidae sp. FL0641]
MTFTVDNAIIRTGSPKDVALYLQDHVRHAGWKPVSDHLLASIDSGAVSPTVLHIFLAICKDPLAVNEILRQRVSAHGRYLAIRSFGRWLRKRHGFVPVWDAVRGAEGLAELMAEMSVNHVQVLCELIRASSNAQGSRALRQQRVTELFHLLHNKPGDDGPKNPDTRPLKSIYKKLLPACSAEAVLATVPAAKQASSKAAQAHRVAFEEVCLRTVFPSEGKGEKLSPYKFLIEKDLSFSFDVLGRLASNTTHLETNADNFFADIAFPLARRLCNRQAPDDVQIRFYTLVLRCIELKPKLSDGMREGFITKAIEAWKRARDDRETLAGFLAMLIRALSPRRQFELDKLPRLLRTVGPGLRFSLLQILLRNLKAFELELDLSSDAAFERVRSLDKTWPPELFLALPSGVSLSLFEYLREAYRHDKFISRANNYSSDTLMSIPSIDDFSLGDPDLLFAILQSRHNKTRREDQSWLEPTKKVLMERRLKSMKTREPSMRASLAQSCMALALASGSLDLFADTSLWARRFNRDPLTVRKMYSDEVLLADEGLHLLVALPQDMTCKESFPNTMEEEIERANSLLLQDMETIDMLLQEPTITEGNIRSQNPVSDLFGRAVNVVRERVSRVDKIPDGQISDNELHRVIWKPTIDLVLTLERITLQPAYKLLGRHTLDGILYDHQKHEYGRSVRKFLDNLGAARDKLWQEYRPTVFPSVVALEDPWPRGLPIQRLCPILEDYEDMQYLQSRAEAVIFAEAQTVFVPIPAEEDVKEAIGPFIDHYKFALHVLISSRKEQPEREAQAIRAWEHAVIEFKPDGMSPFAAKRFWKGVFDEVPNIVLPTSIISELPPGDLILPEVGDNHGPVEWSPVPPTEFVGSRDMTRPKEICSTCLFAMVSPHIEEDIERRQQCGIQAPFPSLSARTSSAQDASIWTKYDSPLRLKPSVREALGAATLLYINAELCSDSSLLIQPFPSPDDVRLPPVFLDQDFLEYQSKKRDLDAALALLSHLSVNIPTQLLERLAVSLLERLDTPVQNESEIRGAAVAIIKRLSRGDRPVTACPLIRHVILSRQSDSSWHRQLFSIKLLRNLPASDARGFFEDTCVELLEKLQQSKGHRLETDTRQSVEMDERPVSTPQTKAPEPPVKVTTVKMIAQRLRGAQHVDHGFALSVLTRLLDNSSHVDVQVAVIQSLLEMLADTEDEGLQQRILGVLAEHAVPLAASINADRPPTEAEWREAEAGKGEMPAIYEGDSLSSAPPVMELLVDATPPYAPQGHDHQRHETWMQRIIVPMLVQSASNYQRWLSIFLRRNEFGLSADDLPAVPLMPRIAADIMKSYPRYFPRSMYDSLHKLTLLNIKPSEDIRSVSEAVNNRKELLASNGGKHWRAIWSTSRPSILGCEQSIELLVTPEFTNSPESLSGLTVSEIQDDLVDIFRACMDVADSPETRHWRIDLIRRLCTRHGDTKKYALWESNVAPLIQRLQVLVQSLRTEQWQCDPKRRPAILPNSYSIRLALMNTKYWSPGRQADPRSNIEAFSGELVALLADQLDGGTPYHAAMVEIKESVGLLGSYSLQFALSLGYGKQEMEFLDLLRIELAAEALTNIRPLTEEDEQDVGQMFGMLEDWKLCPIEHVRDLSYRTLRMLRDSRRFGLMEFMFVTGASGL